MNELVSIIITTYNRPQWLEQAIQSAMDQTYQPIEVIVVDDGSDRDDTKEIAARYPRVKYIYQKNKGLGAARNLGIASSKGEWIQFLDDDDWLDISSVEEKVKVANANPGVSIVYSDLYIVDEDDGKLSKYYEGYPRPLPAGEIYAALARRNFIPIHAMLMEKKALDRMNGFPTRSGAEDWECLVKISEFSKFAFIDEALGYYRLHHGNMTYKADQQMAGETLTQKYIITSQAFQQVPSATRIKIITGFSWQQWRDGDPLFARQLLSNAGQMEGNRFRIFALKFLMLFGRPFSRLIQSIIFNIKLLLKPYPRSYKLFVTGQIDRKSNKEF